MIKEIIKEDPEVQSHTLSSHALPWIAGISIRRSNNLRISCIDGALMRVNSLHSFCDLISGEGFLKSLASEFT